MMVRIEAPDDYAAIRRLHVSAFPSTAEADLVEHVRRDGDAMISLVALDGAALVGHVMLSRMRAPFNTLGLAPVAVAADKRRQGIAARLIEGGIARARAGGWHGIFVLGDPDYYGRFGFRADAAAALQSPYAGPHLMLLALGGKPLGSGRVDYASAFSAFE
jgi:putative acetyltransferase